MTNQKLITILLQFTKNKLLLVLIVFFFVSVHPRIISSESFHLTTYYPAPYGGYARLLTTDITLLAVKGGNVGIGTTSPGYKLDVQGGGIRVSGLTQVGNTRHESIQFETNRNFHRIIFHELRFSGSGSSSGTDMVTFKNGNVGIGTQDPEYTLTVNGSAWAHGGIWTGSDRRWKKDISPLKDSLNKVMKLQGVRYNWKIKEFSELKFSATPQIGLIGQDTEKVIPEVVTTDNNGYKGISYEKLVPVLVEAIKEQQNEIEKLKEKIALLEK